MTATIDLDGNLWIGDMSDPAAGDPVLEGEDVRIRVERTDHDEVAIHATFDGDDNAAVTLYFSRAAGMAMSRLIEREAIRDL